MASAFFKNLFGSKTQQEPQWEPKIQDVQLEQQSLRVVTFRESPHGHRTLLFDSKATELFEEPFAEDTSAYNAIYDGQYAYKIAKNGNDIKEFGECMLGTIPIAYQTDVLKVRF